ncbi:MAG: hypothetical protein ACI8RD_007864 [Bacillariaceae sp.]|jgi:hypothetical protein
MDDSQACICHLQIMDVSCRLMDGSQGRIISHSGGPNELVNAVSRTSSLWSVHGRDDDSAATAAAATAAAALAVVVVTVSAHVVMSSEVLT